MRVTDMAYLILISLFYVIFIGRTIILMRAGIMPLAIGAGKTGVKRLVEAGFLFGLVWWTFEAVMTAAGTGVHSLPGVMFAPLFDLPLLRVAGLALAGAAVLLFTLSLVSFGDSWRIGVDAKNPGGLVTTGVFRRSRNPIFVSLDALFLGTFLALGGAFFLIALLIILAGVHFQIRAEEKFLAARYGLAYADYRRRVRRYL